MILTLTGVGAGLAGQGLSPERLSPLPTPVTSQGSPGHPHFCPTWLQTGGSHDPYLRVTDLLGQLPESKNPVYFLLRIYFQGYVTGYRWTADEEIHSVRSCGPEHRASVAVELVRMPRPSPPGAHPPGSPSHPVLQGFYGDFTRQAGLINTPLPGGWGMGLKV